MTTPFSIDATHLYRQYGFSQWTFGPGDRLAGVLDHIRKELLEVEAAPSEVSEWADLLILAFDGAMRAGHHPQQLLDAIALKQCVNEGRTWPDWRTRPTDQAIEHVRDDLLARYEAGLISEQDTRTAAGTLGLHTHAAYQDWSVETAPQVDLEAWKRATTPATDPADEPASDDVTGTPIADIDPDEFAAQVEEANNDEQARLATPPEPAEPPTPATPAPQPGPTPAKTVKKTPARKGGRTVTPESQAINEQIRAGLAAGKTHAALAVELGISPGAVKQRVKKHKLATARVAKTSDRTPPTAPKATPAPAVPKPPAHADPPQVQRKAADQLVPAFGAHRRILSLWAIGYDPDILNPRLPGFTVEEVLAAEEITFGQFQDVDRLWRMKKFSPRTPTPGWNLDRDQPGPGAWKNIDDPNEVAVVRR